MQIYLIRHGETKENKTGIVQGKGVDGILTEKGKKQAESFFSLYNQHGFEMVFTSSLKRSIETVQSFIDIGVPWKNSSDLDEIGWGAHEGKKYNPVLIENYKQLIAKWKKGNLDARLPEGESANELIARVDSFIESIWRLDLNKILVCTHGRTMRCLLCRFLKLDLSEMENFRHSNTGLFIINRQNNKFQLLKQNDVSHLSNDLLPGDQDF